MNQSPYDHCCCLGRADPCELCESELAFCEMGKKVKLSLDVGEAGKAIVLDGCVFKDNDPKCDGLFLFRTSSERKHSCLVELKGAGNIPRAFSQLAYVRHERKEYREIIQSFREDGRGALTERAVIITNGSLSKPVQERLESKYNIRVWAIIHCEATSKVPDLRKTFRSSG